MLADCASWPDWWQGVEDVIEIDSGDARRVGSVYRITWRAPVLAYRVRFDFTVGAVAEPAAMTGTAAGVLEGAGTWRLFEQDGVCAVTFDWEVRIARRWIGALAAVARPALTASHQRLMRRGGRDLARRMGVRLLASG